MSSFKSMDNLDVTETFGANIQMPDQIDIKSLAQKFHNAISYSMPHLDLNWTYKQSTIKSKSRKAKRKKTGKTSTVKFKESNKSRTISIENVKRFQQTQNIFFFKFRNFYPNVKKQQ